MLIRLFFGIVAFYPGMLAQQIQFGKCQDITVQEDFDPERFEGLWFEQRTTLRLNLIEANQKCVKFDFSNIKKGVLTIESYKVGKILGTKMRKVKTVKPQEPGHYKSTTYDYKVLATDYNHYAVITACENGVLTHNNIIWILSRNREMSMEHMEEAMNKVQKAGLPNGGLRSTIQKDCPMDNPGTVESTAE